MVSLRKIKVLVVDDSAFMRKVITDFVNDHPNLEVIAKARNGQDAIRKINQYKPDVITLDIELPDMSGLDVLKVIMADMPTPTIVLSSITKQGAKTTLEAMQLGAVDFISKPSGSISLDLYKVRDDIVRKIIDASSAKIQQIVTKNKGISSIGRELESKSSKDYHTQKKKLVCIGTSTGGPRALQAVLTQIPNTIEAPILIVQHMPPHFTASLAERLDDLSDVKVKEAQDGDILHNGTAYIAPGGYHMLCRQVGRSLAIQLDTSDSINGHKPSVNVLFEGLAALTNYHIISVIMTGMGSDGTIGLRKLKEMTDVYSIAESKDTAVIYGMPKSVIESHLVDEVVPLHEIASSIMRLI